MIANAYFLYKNVDYEGDELDEDARGFLKAQIARGAFELIGGGYVLWIPDLIVTINRECCSSDEYFDEYYIATTNMDHSSYYEHSGF